MKKQSFYHNTKVTACKKFLLLLLIYLFKLPQKVKTAFSENEICITGLVNTIQKWFPFCPTLAPRKKKETMQSMFKVQCIFTHFNLQKQINSSYI